MKAPIIILATLLTVAVLPLRAQVVNDGATSTLSNATNPIAGDVTVGTNGSFTLLLLSDNALLTNSLNGIIGRNVTAKSNEVRLLSATARWRMGGTLYIGSNGANASLIVSNGAFVDDGSASFGFRLESSNNFALVSGPGSLWSNRFGLDIGGLGRGNQMIVSNGGLVISRTARLGVDASAGNNLAMVSGSGSVWSNATSLSVGNIAPGNRLVIEAGGLVSSDTGIIGDFGSASNNEALVTGPGSLWRNNGLVIGSQIGFNRLVVSNGAAVLSGGGGSLGASSNNKLVVTGNGSIWSNATTLFLMNRADVVAGGWLACTDGYLASSNSVVVLSGPSGWNNLGDLRAGDSVNGTTLLASNGATVLSSNAFIGAGTSLGNNNLALLTGSGTRWSNRSDLIIGTFGVRNQLVLSNGATMFVGGHSTVGQNSSAVSNSVLATGPGTSWTVASNLYVGSNGPRSRLFLTGGARLNSGGGEIGSGFLGGNLAVVDGAGSVWSNRTRLNVGSFSASNQLLVANGARLDSANSYVGANPGGYDNEAVVTGPGSEWNNSAFLVVGDSASGNRLVVSNAARLTSSGSSIGNNSSGANNQIIVTGAGSQWTDIDVIVVGDLGTGNRLTIRDNAEVSTHGMFLGLDPLSSNSALIVDTGSLRVMSPAVDGILQVGRGTNLFNAGLIETDFLLLTNAQGQFEFNGGTLITRGATISNNNFFIVGRSGTTPAVWDVRPGSSDHMVGELFVGDNLASDQLLISNGARFRSIECFLGHAVTSSSNLVRVTGSGTLWTNTQDLYLGSSSPGNQLVVSNGATVDCSSALIGMNASSNNLAVVTGIDSSWIQRGELHVGRDMGGNRLIVSGGGRVSTGAERIIGYKSGANSNLVLVADPGSRWIGSGVVYVGDQGVFNQLIVSNGAAVLDSTGIVGATDSSRNNSAIVTGAGSTWTNLEEQFVGWDGSGNQLAISNAATVFAGANRALGEFPFANSNAVMVTGPGSSWLGPDSLRIGNSGSYNRLFVNKGGQVVNGLGVIGATGNSNEVIFTDSGSEWTNQLDLTIGESSAGNRLIVSNGASVATSNGFLGRNTSANLNSALITDPGTRWLLSSNLHLGSNGAFNRLVISNGARVENGRGSIGTGFSSSNNLAVVTGSGSVWSNASELFIGADGRGNQLVVSNGGTVISSAGGIGVNSNTRSNVVVVTGSGSVWSNAGSLSIGQGSGNRLLVSDGATVLNIAGFIGSGTSSSNNAVLVTGPGSEWRTTFNMGVGLSGPGNQLVVSNGGVVFVGNGFSIGSSSSSTNNRVVIEGGTLRSTNSLGISGYDIRRGTNVFNGGVIETDRLLLTNTLGRFEFNSGTVQTRNTSVSNGVVFLVGNGSSPATFSLRNGTHSFANNLVVASNASLIGVGTITGILTVQSGGTLSPGASAGTIILSNAPMLQGTTFMEISKNGSALTNDVLQVPSVFLYGGSLIVSNAGPDALAAGDRFRLFVAGGYSGSFSNLVLPPPAPGLTWRNDLAVDGSITVVTIPSPGFGAVSLSGTNLILSGTNGTPGGNYAVLTATNVALPASNWLALVTNQFSAGGAFSFTNGIPPGEPQRFFRLRMP